MATELSNGIPEIIKFVQKMSFNCMYQGDAQIYLYRQK